MKKITVTALAAAILLVAGCSEPAPKIAGNMTEATVCSTGNLIVRRALERQWGENFKTDTQDCSAVNTRGNQVTINSAYENTINGNKLNFVAEGEVQGDTLRINTIQVKGVDDAPVEFGDFPG